MGIQVLRRKLSGHFQLLLKKKVCVIECICENRKEKCLFVNIFL
jgi:hypothetical protein